MSFARRLKHAAGALALGGAIVTGAAVDQASADQIRWKMPIAFASKLPGLGSPSQYVAKQLDAASGGDVQVRVF